MSPRQPRPPRTAAGLRQPAPGQQAKQPQGENAIPGTTSRSPSARKTEAGPEPRADSRLGSHRPAQLNHRTRSAVDRGAQPRERPAQRSSCRLHGPASPRAASLRSQLQNRVPESSGIKDTPNCKAARTAGPRSRLRGGAGRNPTHSTHVCMLTPHMPPLHPILYTQTPLCTPYTPSNTLTKCDACTHSTHPPTYTTHA